MELKKKHVLGKNTQPRTCHNKLNDKTTKTRKTDYNILAL